MTSISLEMLLTIIYTHVDDWYQSRRAEFKRKRGRSPLFSDSEIITLMVAEDFIPYPAEAQYIEYIRANHLDLFPNLLGQSQFNRRARNLRAVIERMRRDWLVTLEVGNEEQYLLDTKPVPVVGYKRSKKRSHFRGSASYGYCASRKMRYFGYKLVMITTLDGLPVLYDLVPANTDERKAAEAVLHMMENAQIIGDKGFIGAEWQTRINDETGNEIVTPKRKNQKIQHPEGVEEKLNSVRERIEGVFHELQNTGRNLERLLAKSVAGLCTRVIAKVTSHLLRHILKQRYQIDVQTFTCASSMAF